MLPKRFMTRVLIRVQMVPVRHDASLKVWREGKSPMVEGDSSGVKKAHFEEASEEETQEPATLWDACIDMGEYIHESISYEKDVATIDEMDDDSLFKTIECHGLQMIFLGHQCRRRMLVRNMDVDKLLRGREEAAKAYEHLSRHYHALQKKY
jgi:hypothetical protein